MNRDFDYEKNNIAYDCQYTRVDGGGIKCKNYILCESVTGHFFYKRNVPTTYFHLWFHLTFF